MGVIGDTMAMMNLLPATDLKEAVESAARELVAVRHWGETSFVSLPG